MKLIIVENNESWLNRMNKITNDLLTSENFEIEIITFNKYNNKLKELIYDNSEKIFILDFQLDDTNAYEIANEIRESAHDWKSVIIICSIFNKKESIISARLAILTYISKDDDFDSNLHYSILTSIKILANYQFIEIKEKKQTYKLAINDIIWIKKEKNSKYCIVRTANDEFRTRSSLSNLNKKLNFTKINYYTIINPIHNNKPIKEQT